MPHHFKVHELLSRDELTQLEDFAREPGRTVDECYQWMLERGFTLSRSAVGTWLRAFREQCMKERFSASSELARAIKGAVKSNEFGDIADAAVMQLAQVVFEQAAQLQGDGKVDPLDVQRMTRSLKNLIGGKAELTAMLAEKFDKETQRRVAERRQLTSEDLAEIRKAVFG